MNGVLVGVDPAELVPGDRGGDRRSWPGAHGVRRNGGLAVAVALHVEEDAIATLGLPRLEGEQVGLALDEDLRRLAGEGAHVVEGLGTPQRHDDVVPT